MFGSTNTGNNNWGASTGFAKSSSFSGLSGGSNSLFGNSGGASSNTNSAAGTLFGSTNATNPTSGQGSAVSGGLFGNSKVNSGSTSQALFAKPAGAGGLFGNSGNASNPQQTASTGMSSGLFESSKRQAPSGTFGNPTNNTATASGGLFGNSGNTVPTSGGLFGNSSTNNAISGAGLFGSNAVGSGIGSIQKQNQNIGGGLFGSSNANVGSSLFGAPQQQTTYQPTINTSNPYSYDKVLTNLQTTLSGMPESITNNLVAEDEAKDTGDRKRRFSYLEKKSSDKPQSSLLGKLGRTFRVFRNSAASTGLSSIRGLFTDSNYTKSNINQSILPKQQASGGPKNGVSKPSFRSSVDSRRMGSIKKLIIKSKPSKFHLIDADRVINTKRARLANVTNLGNDILPDKYSSDEDSEGELEQNTQKGFSRYPYNILKDDDVKNKSNLKTIIGKSVELTEEVEEESSIKYNKDGYWSSPSIDELSSMSLEELSSIDNFILGRKGFGQLAYNFPVDLSLTMQSAQSNRVLLEKELFGNTFQLERMIVLLYTNDAHNKPPIGMGLNVPATVTLEGAKPREGVPVGDYIKQLKLQKGMEFVTYDPITFVWVSKVKHFSVWGLIEDDGTELSKKYMEMKRKQDEYEETAELEYSRVYENREYLQEIKKQKLLNQTIAVPGGWKYANTTQQSPLDFKRKLLNNEINSQLDLHRKENVVNELSHVSDITLDSDENDRSVSPDSIVFAENEDLSDGGNNFDYLKQLVGNLPADVDMDEIVNEKAYEPEIVNDAVFDSIQIWPNLATSEDWIVQLKLANDMNSALAQSFGDSEGAKKQISPEDIDAVLFADFNRESLKKDQISTPSRDNKLAVIEDIEPQVDDEIFPNNISRILYDFLTKTIIETRTNSYPKVVETSGLSFVSLITNDLVKDEKQLFSLGASLFDKLSTEKYTELEQNIVNYLNETGRKRAFNIWLKEYNSNDIEILISQVQSNSLELIFVYVCAGDLKEAINIALESNNSHLSVILTLTDSNDDAVRGIASQQLKAWRDSSSLHLIPSPVVKIYKILSGEFDDFVNELPWNINLALKLYYGDESAKLHEVLNDSLERSDNAASQASEVIDILQVYCSFQTDGKDKALKKLISSSLNSKLKWFFFKVISSDVVDTTFDGISLSFGMYLESVKLWKEAIFVYSHLSDDEQSKNKLRDVVISSIKNINSDDKNYLVSVLKVPTGLLSEAIGISKGADGDHWGECEAFIDAQLWENAHFVIITKLGPHVVISKNKNAENSLLELISRFPQKGTIISTWNSGAGIYEKYIALTRDENNIEVLRFLLSNIPLAKEISSFETKSALKIISRKVGDVAIEKRSDVDGVEGKVQQLYLGESEKKYFSVRLQTDNV